MGVRRRVRLSVIVPAHNGAAVLAESLPALLFSDVPRATWELIVVDDASSDDTYSIAARYADRVVRLRGTPRGPAYARNRGSEVARGDILVFVDADVCVHHDTLSRFMQVLSHQPDAAAVFGAYDAKPRARTVVSQYRNLLHRYVHCVEAGDADTFWAGCGAVRRAEFVRAGGFDAVQYPRPQIEDIALGYRLRSLGCRILLRPEIQGTHLKRWTLSGMLRNDLFDRGVPWMRLLLARQAPQSGSLNVRTAEKIYTVLTTLGLGGLALAALTRSLPLLAVASACLLVMAAGNFPLFRWFRRARGIRFALSTVPLRVLYYLLNALAVAIAVTQHAAVGFSARRVASVHGTQLAVDGAVNQSPGL